MKKLTLAFQDEMNVKIEDGKVVIDIPKECRRDLWLAQISYWLEDEQEKLMESGNLRLESNRKLKLSKYR